MGFRMSLRPQDPHALCAVCGQSVGRPKGAFTLWDLQDRPVCEACAYALDPSLQQTAQVLGALVHSEQKSGLLWEYAQAEVVSCHRFRGFARRQFRPGGYAEEPGRVEVDYVDRLLTDDSPVQVLIPRGVPPELAAGLLEEITRSIRTRRYAAPEVPEEESA